MTLMMKARQFAEEKHLEQTYDGGSYVRNHLDRVVGVLTRFGVTRPEILAAGYLHDTLEDTHTDVQELIKEIGPEVAHLVTLLTDLPGSNRRERQERTYEAMRPYENAVTVKLADRIANVEASLHTQGKSFFGMYRKEHDFFKARLHMQQSSHPTLTAMWAHLDGLIASEWLVRLA